MVYYQSSIHVGDVDLYAIGYAFENKETIKEVASEAVEVGKEVAGVGKQALIEVAAVKREILDAIDDEIKEYHREKKDEEFEQKIKAIQKRKESQSIAKGLYISQDMDKKETRNIL